jgi:hypothetical protein
VSRTCRTVKPSPEGSSYFEIDSDFFAYHEQPGDLLVDDEILSDICDNRLEIIKELMVEGSPIDFELLYCNGECVYVVRCKSEEDAAVFKLKYF